MPYWAKTYGEGVANGVVIDKNGDIIMVGQTKDKNGFVARLDRKGNVKWFRTYGGDNEDSFEDVKIASNGDIIVAGYYGATGEHGSGANAWVLRLDSEGNIKWQKTYGGSYSEGADAVVIAPNGDVIVAGHTWSFGAGDYDIWVLRLDGNGNIKWQKTYGGSYWDVASAVAVTLKGDIIVAGYTGSFSDVSVDAWILRLDAKGNVKWQKTYREGNFNEVNAVTIANNGDIIVAGDYVLDIKSTSIPKAWILRLDAKGNVKWQRACGWDGGVLYSLALAPNGDIIAAGTAIDWGFTSKVWVLRLDENGNVKWQKTYGGSSSDKAYAVAIAPNSDLMVAGFYEATNWKGYGANIWLLRLPPDGEIPDCDIIQESKAKVMDTNAKVTDTRCEVTVPSPEEVKVTPSNAVVSTPIVKIKTQCEWSGPEIEEAQSKSLSSTVVVWETPSAFPGFPQSLLSRYEPLEFLGEGGFAKVFKVKRKSDGQIVALKIPRIDERTSGLFIKEVAAWYNLNHENIVRLYRADILPVPYLEMEFVEGVELNGKAIRDLDAYPKPVEEETALKIITGIAEGLKHAHSKGIYHLDLKPLNVLLKSDLTPKITDWGLAKISARSSLSQHYGYSPLYASPEQLDEETFGVPDHRTDIYQLGLIFYELLTGELPYSATTPGALIGKIIYKKPKKPSEINPALARYDGLFEKLLAKKKEDRFSSVEEFLEALNSLGELEREKEELKKTTTAMRKSRSREEFERLKVESVRKTIKIAILSAKLNDKAELLRALDDLRFETRENFDDLVRAIEQVELLLKEGIPIGNETFEMLRALLLRIEGEVSR